MPRFMLAVAAAFLVGCAHKAELTGDEHRAAATRAEQKADVEKRANTSPLLLPISRMGRCPRPGWT